MALTTDFAGIDAGSRAAESKDHSRYRIVPARHPGRLAGTIFAALVIIAVLYSIFTNPRWGWSVFAEWFFAEPVLVGLGRTLLLTVLAAISGSILGTALALARVSKSPLLSGLSWGYIWLLRSIPVIVLLLILNNLVEQIERGEWKDSHGHDLRMTVAFHEAQKLLTDATGPTQP